MSDPKTFTQEDLDAAIAKANEKHDDDVAGLRKKVDELIATNKTLKRGAEIKPEDLAAAEERADKAESALAEQGKQIKALTTDRDKAVKALETESGFTHKLVAENGVIKALADNGVTDPAYLEAAKAMHLGAVKVVAEGDTRKAMYGDKELGDAIKEWASGDVGKKFVSAPNNSGGGAPGGKGGEGGGKVATRAQFDAMDQGARASFAKDGGKVVDQAA